MIELYLSGGATGTRVDGGREDFGDALAYSDYKYRQFTDSNGWGGASNISFAQIRVKKRLDILARGDRTREGKPWIFVAKVDDSGVVSTYYFEQGAFGIWPPMPSLTPGSFRGDTVQMSYSGVTCTQQFFWNRFSTLFHFTKQKLFALSVFTKRQEMERASRTIQSRRARVTVKKQPLIAWPPDGSCSYLEANDKAGAAYLNKVKMPGHIPLSSSLYFVKVEIRSVFFTASELEPL